MLSTTLTLSVDPENDGSPVSVVLRRDQEYADRSVYSFPDADAADHNVSFHRARPKTSGNFAGVARTRQKVTKPQTVLGIDGSSIKSPAIVEISTSFPKGMTAAQKLDILQESLAIYTHSEVRVNHYQNQEV